MILIVGATGLVGGLVTRKLLGEGKKVRALVRNGGDSAKHEALKLAGAELVFGDLKQPDTFAAALRGVKIVVSTANSVSSRQDGDEIESVDRLGTLALISAAAKAGVEQFVYLSFRDDPSVQFPLGKAKRECEAALRSSGMGYTIIQASWFMEAWFSPMMGFSAAEGKARIFGTGDNPVSYVSFMDVVNITATVVGNAKAKNRTIEFGGPEALAPNEVVKIFETALNRPFQVERVPESQLAAEMAAAPIPLYQSFSGLMWQCARGDKIDMTATLADFPMSLTSVRDFARRVAESK